MQYNIVVFLTLTSLIACEASMPSTSDLGHASSADNLDSTATSTVEGHQLCGIVFGRAQNTERCSSQFALTLKNCVKWGDAFWISAMVNGEAASQFITGPLLVAPHGEGFHIAVTSNVQREKGNSHSVSVNLKPSGSDYEMTGAISTTFQAEQCENANVVFPALQGSKEIQTSQSLSEYTSNIINRVQTGLSCRSVEWHKIGES